MWQEIRVNDAVLSLWPAKVSRSTPFEIRAHALVATQFLRVIL